LLPTTPRRGIGLGLVTAFAAGRYVQSQLFGVNAGDPVVFAAGGASLLAASLAAALRALRTD